MSNGWSGADPTQSSDGASYELGTEFLVGSQPIVISAVRVWAGAAGSGTVSNRKGRVWTNSGTLLATAAMPNTLPSGWTTYNLGTPVSHPAGSRVVVSYTTGGNYGELVGGLTSDVVSSDGAVTAEGYLNSTNGNGVFSTTTTQFPSTASGTHTFYGIDIVYTVGSGGPTITSFTAVNNVPTATVTATLTATDPNGLGGAVYLFDWGDGNVTAGSSNTATHAYTSTGLYAVRGVVTDALGLDASAAKAVNIPLVPGPVLITPITPPDVELLLVNFIQQFLTFGQTVATEYLSGYNGTQTFVLLNRIGGRMRPSLPIWLDDAAVDISFFAPNKSAAFDFCKFLRPRILALWSYSVPEGVVTDVVEDVGPIWMADPDYSKAGRYMIQLSVTVHPN